MRGRACCSGQGPRRARRRLSFAGLAALMVLIACSGTTGLDHGRVTVTITSPANDATVSGTVTVSGTSSLATTVALSVDGGAFETANGTDRWNVVIEEGALGPGEHTLTATAIGATGSATTSVIVNFENGPGLGTRQITYFSSVDGAAMGAQLYVPPSAGALSGPVPLVIHLHGGGGLGRLRPSVIRELDDRGWIGIAPDGRRWGLADLGCSWRTSAAYVDNPDPAVGPGEQDILDAIAWARTNYSIDPDRIYLFGFSMGGRGTYAIGLKNPDLFAAIAPMGPASDMFEIFVRRPEPSACKEGMVGGRPGDSPRVNTMYSITSGRFLIENAYNLPLFVAHGLDDQVAYNLRGTGIYAHGWHLTDDVSWSACHGGSALCFGHTPTLSELRSRHPDGYVWEKMFTPGGHVTNDAWIPAIFDFFARHRRVESPETIVFKTYEDEHETAYWLRLDIERPWENVPGAVRARRDAAANELMIDVARASRVLVDLDHAGVTLDGTLTIRLGALREPVYDPALTPDAAEPQNPVIALSGSFTGSGAVVRRDGVALGSEEVSFRQGLVEIGPVAVGSPTVLTVELTP